MSTTLGNDLPPAYLAPTEYRDLPEYSSLPGQFEHALEPGTRNPGQYMIRSKTLAYTSANMHVDLASHQAPFPLPAYGLNATVGGSVKFTGKMKNIERVIVKLEGFVTNDVNTPTGTVAKWYQKYTLLSMSECLYDSSETRHAAPLAPDALRTFKFQLPSQQPNGAWLPPTAKVILQNAICLVQYSLSFTMVRKGWRLNESINIPILYLPKSNPTRPPVPLENMLGNQSLFWDEDGVTTSVLRPLPASRSQASNQRTSMSSKRLSWMSTSTPRTSMSSHSSVANTIHLSLPSNLCFTSGESIPFILTITCEDNPEIKRLLPAHIRVTLLRRVELWVPSRRDKPVASQDKVIGYGQTESSTSSSDGLLTLGGNIDAGEPGAEVSWNVPGVAEVSHFIRVTMLSPPELQDVFPSVCHEQACFLVTDSFGRYSSELLATGGIPTLALSMSLTPSKFLHPVSI